MMDWHKFFFLLLVFFAASICVVGLIVVLAISFAKFGSIVPIMVSLFLLSVLIAFAGAAE